MMDVYVFQADIYCASCGESLRASLTNLGVAPANPDDESSYDSDLFPKGPYADGGGEADSPQHCAGGEACPGWDGTSGVFLENSLTAEGRKFVQDCVNERIGAGSSAEEMLTLFQWMEYYDIHYIKLPETP